MAHMQEAEIALPQHASRSCSNLCWTANRLFLSIAHDNWNKAYVRVDIQIYAFLAYLYMYH